MVREDILGGLKSSIQRGEPLKKAMITFYNAGYRKEEIEEAAKFLVQSQRIIQPQLPVQIKKKVSPAKKILLGRGQPIQKVSNYQAPSQIQIPQQKVSSYEEPKKPKKKIWIILLIFFLVILLGVLLSAFLFKNELMEMIGEIF